MPDDVFAELQRAIEEDWRTGRGRFPDQAIFALRDERCAQAIRERTDGGMSVVDVREAGYDGQTGLVSVCFVFERPEARVKLERDGVLAVLRALDCSVVAVIAPFDPDQPNPILPPPPTTQGDSPFVVSRPSGAAAGAIPAEQLGQLERRAKKYLSEVAGIWAEPRTDTNCWWSTSTYTAMGIWDRSTDQIPDDCGPQI